MAESIPDGLKALLLIVFFFIFMKPALEEATGVVVSSTLLTLSFILLAIAIIASMFKR
ncbi:MAG: hypothetical protein ACOX79_12295 [Methanosarcina sp.]